MRYNWFDNLFIWDFNPPLFLPACELFGETVIYIFGVAYNVEWGPRHISLGSATIVRTPESISPSRSSRSNASAAGSSFPSVAKFIPQIMLHVWHPITLSPLALTEPANIWITSWNGLSGLSDHRFQHWQAQFSHLRIEQPLILPLRPETFCFYQMILPSP